MPANLFQRLVRIPPWPEPVRTIQEIRFKYRFQVSPHAARQLHVESKITW